MNWEVLPQPLPHPVYHFDCLRLTRTVISNRWFGPFKYQFEGELSYHSNEHLAPLEAWSGLVARAFVWGTGVGNRGGKWTCGGILLSPEHSSTTALSTGLPVTPVPGGQLLSSSHYWFLWQILTIFIWRFTHSGWKDGVRHTAFSVSAFLVPWVISLWAGMIDKVTPPPTPHTNKANPFKSPHRWAFLDISMNYFFN